MFRLSICPFLELVLLLVQVTELMETLDSESPLFSFVLGFDFGDILGLLDLSSFPFRLMPPWITHSPFPIIGLSSAPQRC